MADVATSAAPAAPPAAALPAATPPAPAAPAAEVKPASTGPAVRKMLGQVTKKTYSTRSSATSPMPTAPATPESAPAPSTAPATPDGTAFTPGADSGAAPRAEAKETAAAESAAEPAEKPEALTEAEFSRRMAKLTRASENVAKQRQDFARERQEHAQNLQKLQIVERAAQAAKANPLAFLQQAFGIQPQQVLDAIIADGAKPEATRAQEQNSEQAKQFDERLKKYETELAQEREARAREKLATDFAEYQDKSIVPLFANAKKYELTLRYFDGNTKAAASEVFALIQNRYNFTLREAQEGKRQGPETLSPDKAADLIELTLKQRRDKLTGSSVPPSEPTPPKRQEPATASANGSPTHNRTHDGRYSTPRKPYTVKRVAS